jgi:hypothetical protein
MSVDLEIAPDIDVRGTKIKAKAETDDQVR